MEEKTIPRDITIKFLRTSKKEKNLKSSQRKKKHHIQKKKDSRYLIRNNGRQNLQGA